MSMPTDSTAPRDQDTTATREAASALLWAPWDASTWIGAVALALVLGVMAAAVGPEWAGPGSPRAQASGEVILLGPAIGVDAPLLADGWDDDGSGTVTVTGLSGQAGFLPVTDGSGTVSLDADGEPLHFVLDPVTITLDPDGDDGVEGARIACSPPACAVVDGYVEGDLDVAFDLPPGNGLLPNNFLFTLAGFVGCGDLQNPAGGWGMAGVMVAPQGTGTQWEFDLSSDSVVDFAPLTPVEVEALLADNPLYDGEVPDLALDGMVDVDPAGAGLALQRRLASYVHDVNLVPLDIPFGLFSGFFVEVSEPGSVPPADPTGLACYDDWNDLHLEVQPGTTIGLAPQFDGDGDFQAFGVVVDLEGEMALPIQQSFAPGEVPCPGGAPAPAHGVDGLVLDFSDAVASASLFDAASVEADGSAVVDLICRRYDMDLTFGADLAVGAAPVTIHPGATLVGHMTLAEQPLPPESPVFPVADADLRLDGDASIAVTDELVVEAQDITIEVEHTPPTSGPFALPGPVLTATLSGDAQVTFDGGSGWASVEQGSTLVVDVAAHTASLDLGIAGTLELDAGVTVGPGAALAVTATWADPAFTELISVDGSLEGQVDVEVVRDGDVLVDLSVQAFLQVGYTPADGITLVLPQDPLLTATGQVFGVDVDVALTLHALGVATAPGRIDLDVEIDGTLTAGDWGFAPGLRLSGWARPSVGTWQVAVDGVLEVGAPDGVTVHTAVQGTMTDSVLHGAVFTLEAIAPNPDLELQAMVGLSGTFDPFTGAVDLASVGDAQVSVSGIEVSGGFLLTLTGGQPTGLWVPGGPVLSPYAVGFSASGGASIEDADVIVDELAGSWTFTADGAWVLAIEADVVVAFAGMTLRATVDVTGVPGQLDVVGTATLDTGIDTAEPGNEQLPAELAVGGTITYGPDEPTRVLVQVQGSVSFAAGLHFDAGLQLLGDATPGGATQVLIGGTMHMADELLSGSFLALATAVDGDWDFFMGVNAAGEGPGPVTFTGQVLVGGTTAGPGVTIHQLQGAASLDSPELSGNVTVDLAGSTAGTLSGTGVATLTTVELGGFALESPRTVALDLAVELTDGAVTTVALAAPGTVSLDLGFTTTIPGWERDYSGFLRLQGFAVSYHLPTASVQVDVGSAGLVLDNEAFLLSSGAQVDFASLSAAWSSSGGWEVSGDVVIALYADGFLDLVSVSAIGIVELEMVGGTVSFQGGVSSEAGFNGAVVMYQAMMHGLDDAPSWMPDWLKQGAAVAAAGPFASVELEMDVEVTQLSGVVDLASGDFYAEGWAGLEADVNLLGLSGLAVAKAQGDGRLVLTSDLAGLGGPTGLSNVLQLLPYDTEADCVALGGTWSWVEPPPPGGDPLPGPGIDEGVGKCWKIVEVSSTGWGPGLAVVDARLDWQLAGLWHRNLGGVDGGQRDLVVLKELRENGRFGLCGPKHKRLGNLPWSFVEDVVVGQLPCTVGWTVPAEGQLTVEVLEGQQPVAGVTAELLSASGAVVASVPTGPDGRAVLTGPVGATTVRIELPGTSWVHVIDPDPVLDGITPGYVTPQGLFSYTFGIASQTTVTGTVWADLDGDGAWGPKDFPLSSQWVALYQGGSLVATTQTNASGQYAFVGQQTGNYLVQPVVPPGWSLSTGNAPAPVVVAAGGASDAPSFGMAPPTATVSGSVFFDGNANGVADEGELPLAERTVRLWMDSTGDGTYDTHLGSTVSDAEGTYVVSGVPVGFSYRLGIVPGPYEVTTDNSPTFLFVASPTGSYGTAFGLRYPKAGEIDGLVMIDGNADGEIQHGEDGLAGGAVVTLFDGAGAEVAVTTTSADGSYSFTGLEVGSYEVQVELPGEQWTRVGDASTSVTVVDLCPGAGCEPTPSTVVVPPVLLVPPAGCSDDPAQRACHPGRAVTGWVLLDADDDGVVSEGDTAAIVRVDLVEPGTGRVLERVWTDADGTYRFASVGPGAYQIRVAQTSPTFRPLVDPDGPTADGWYHLGEGGDEVVVPPFLLDDLGRPATASPGLPGGPGSPPSS